jgi:diguanylate cyclase (GGDEF)-like protein
VWIFQTIDLTETHITQNYTFEWAASPRFKQIGMPMFSMFTSLIDRPEYRDMIDSRGRGEWQKVITSQTVPGWLRDTQEVQKIKSMLTIPIMVENQWWGTLGFDDCEREYDWSDVEISLLKTAGYLISNAVLTDRLSAKRKQFNLLKRLTASSVWEFNFKTGQFWCSPEMIHSVPGLTENVSLSLRGALQLVHSDDRASLMAAARRCVVEGRDVLRHDIRVLTDCGGLRWVELIGNVRHNSKGEAEQFAGIAIDIRARKQEEERLQEEATTDLLTGIMNRRMFGRVLQKQIDISLNEKSTFAVLLFDIDCFKGLNERYGRSVGDQVLRNLVEICSKELRSQDVLARLGGDLFALLMPDMEMGEARAIGEKLRRHIVGTPYFFESNRVVMTSSFGLTIHDGNLTTPSRIIENADMALYAAKRAGRNCLVCDSDSCCTPLNSKSR